MNILGICDSQDAGAAVFIDNRHNIAAINEERLSRIKLDGGFPQRSIQEVLKLKNLKPDDIDIVVLASKMTPCFFLRLLRNTHAKLREKNKQFSLLLSLYILYQVIAHKIVLIGQIESLWSKIYLKNKLRKLGIKCRIIVIDHHAAHAYAAYSTSGFEEALIITIDGLGDGISFTVNIGRDGKIQRIFEQQALNDITLYYSRLTEFLGFIPIQDEGKVMGLAAYSNNPSVLSSAKKLLRILNGRFKARNLFFSFSKDKKIFSQLKLKNKEEIAFSFQTHLESLIVDLIRHWAAKSKIKNIALSGGFFANIKVNQKIAELDEVKNIYIYPHTGDGGLALGAIFAFAKPKPFQLKNLFIGTHYSNEQILRVFKAQQIKYKIIEDMEKYIAQILSQGKIVARFCGSMEYGPRALGNRSILCQATKKETKEILNRYLKRDMFMPFAPSILIEYRNQCCVGSDKAVYTASFMNISFNCTDYFRKTCPVAVHEDGTTRPQFVFKESNSNFYRVIDEYSKITGIPAIINTSFNIHEEPIVCCPEDALRVFNRTKIDYLAIANFLIERSN